MSLLYGMHDEEAIGIVPKDGWVLGLVALSEDFTPKHYDNGVNWLIRVNWGYGTTGTIPESDKWDDYLHRLASFASGSTGATRFIVGNEPNISAEWPNRKPIYPSQYVSLFTKARDVLHGISPNFQVIPAAIAPYNVESGNWLTYLELILGGIAVNGGCDGIDIHAYTRGSDPSLISKDMIVPNGQLQGQQWGFRTYRDALSMVPPSLAHLPSYITEFDEYDAWEDRNTGVVQAAYQEINQWNTVDAHQKVHCLCLYRYPKNDKWFIIGKAGVLADFSEAVGKGYTASVGGEKVFLPVVGTGTPLPPVFPVEEDSVQRDYDPKAVARGVTVDELSSGAGWYCTKIDWLDEKESQGRHHIYFDTLDEEGKRLAGVTIVVNWPTGASKVTSEAKPGEPYSANFPMSPSRNDFSCRVTETLPSEVVRGIGMGADTPSGYNPGIHTSTVVIFQRLTGEGETPSQHPPDGKIPTLVHPVTEPKYRSVTEPFGSTAEDYTKFGLKGHDGVDFAVPTGSDIRAAASGVVQESGYDSTGYGNYIKLVHPWGETLYAHLLKPLVQQGEAVSAGESIGISNASGNATGPHLHFGMRINPYNRADGFDGYIDPMPYLENNGMTVTVPSSDILSAIKQAGEKQGVDWRLLASVAWNESSFRPEIADGLMQIGPQTWSDWASKVGATDINNPLDNARVGAAYLKWLLDYYQGDEIKALTAYNWGIGNVESGGEVPVITQEYVNKVRSGRDLLNAIGVHQ